MKLKFSLCGLLVKLKSKPHRLKSVPLLIPAGPRECINKAAAARGVIPHLESGVEVEDERRGEASAGSVDREHGLSANLEVIDILHHRASPVREVKKIHARLIGVHRRLDRNAAHGFL